MSKNEVLTRNTPMKVGIINCSNYDGDLNCCASCCLKAARECSGVFEQYKETGGVEVVGILSCSGCPTLMAHDKIFRRVRSLVRAGAEAIHFSSCVNNICPFKNKYKSLINEKFPEIRVEFGTHAELISDMSQLPMFAGMIVSCITRQGEDIVNILDTADAVNNGEIRLG